jgi:hypothetical protein
MIDCPDYWKNENHPEVGHNPLTVLVLVSTSTCVEFLAKKCLSLTTL